LTDDDYRIYRIPYETANVINVKLIYGNSKLVAYSNNGQIFIYNEIYDKFELVVNLCKELNNNYFGSNSILLDNTGSYWIASSWGLYKYNKEGLILIDNENVNIQRITWEEDSKIIVSGNESIYSLDIKTLKRIYLYKNIENTPLDVSELYYDKQAGKLWVGTVSNGLFNYDFKTKQYNKSVIQNLPKQPILAIESISETSLLLGIDGQGLWNLTREQQILNV
jgi:ligand-binding sensor domain-containing protein